MQVARRSHGISNCSTLHLAWPCTEKLYAHAFARHACMHACTVLPPTTHAGQMQRAVVAADTSGAGIKAVCRSAIEPCGLQGGAGCGRVAADGTHSRLAGLAKALRRVVRCDLNLDLAFDAM